jgi:hypothetical protein
LVESRLILPAHAIGTPRLMSAHRTDTTPETLPHPVHPTPSTATGGGHSVLSRSLVVPTSDVSSDPGCAESRAMPSDMNCRVSSQTSRCSRSAIRLRSERIRFETRTGRLCGYVRGLEAICRHILVSWGHTGATYHLETQGFGGIRREVYMTVGCQSSSGKHWRSPW